MDEELGVKVTRLRRRLSTEAEGAQSPLTPSTPNKKRGTKLAKPALELIDENVTETVPKKVTRRASTKDAEPVEEKPVTPSRRSTRIRSNTSLLMEATQNMVSESPRAKRALRRTSQIGSDTESATTPARRTRTRKDSTSSVEKLSVTSSNEKVIAQVAEAISEEPEIEISKDTNLNISQNSTPRRTSPRLNKKSKMSPDEQHKVEIEKPEQNDNTLTNTSKLTEDISSSLNGLATIDEPTSSTHDKPNGKSESKDSETPNISLTSAKLITDITTNPKKSTDINKTVSAIEELNNDKDNRKRTKSWTTITASDTPSEIINSPNKFASGDRIIENIDIKSSKKSINKSESIFNTSIENKENIHTLKSVHTLNASDTIKIFERTPSKDIKAVVFIEDSDSNSGSGKLTIDTHDGEEEKNSRGDQCVPVVKEATTKRLTSESFVVEPMDIDETIPENVTINDFSDKSNSSKDENNGLELKPSSPSLNKRSSDVNKSLNKSTRTSISMHQELNNSKQKSSITASEENNDFKDALDGSLLEKSEKKLSISTLYDNDNFNENSNKSKRKSSLSKVDSDNDKRKSSTSSQIEEKNNESSNKSKRKSVSESEQNPEKTSNENKSTLVLSQLKDVSANEANNVSKSPNETNDLSKSVNIPTKETDKKNLSHYLTSTPLHQKPLQKLAMQINSSIISPNVESKNTPKANKSKTPEKEVSYNSDDSDSEESDDDSREKSKMIDDEAEEASDDYESGDSRDAEEKQYEEDHEIIEKGETLESEPGSDDSDYEKDSFIVSSDEEDDDLLSGSGDDLSLTDNELKMTAKSKKKFDERKRKEQKNASKEMYKARHQLNKSDKSSKSKSKARKLKSSSSESDEETQPKKKNRLRIDSSQDVSINNSDADESVAFQKKKAKRLSASVCEDNPNEKEITIQNQSMFERNDPLTVSIKQEPKTPQKHFNMSTVLINDNIEQIEVDTNASMMKPNETSDPLQATLAHEDAESDSDISENMEIKENYDSVLENLNKTNKKDKLKTGDTSLNLNRKSKNIQKEPIIDQLNLTQTKSKKNKAQIAKDNASEKSANKESSASEKQEDDENSDSIDMRLLFPEDSNDSEANSTKFKPEEPAHQFIPLKRTEAKTNLRENMGEPDDTNVNFFIDTKGDYKDEDMDVSTQNSAKKNKKKNKQNVSVDNVAVSDNFAVSKETPINVSVNSDKKKKKKNKSQLEASHIVEDAAPEHTLLNVSTNSDKKKKKNKSQLDISQIVDAAPEETELEKNVAIDIVHSDKKKKKKNRSQLDVSEIVEDAVLEETPFNVSTNSDKKKKKKNKLDVSCEIVKDAASEGTTIDVLKNSDKKKKKKNKSLLDVSQIVEDAAPEEISFNVSTNSEKKKKKNKSLNISHAENTEEIIVNVSQNSNKKKKNKSPTVQEIDMDAAPEDTKDTSQKREKKKKKNKQVDVSQTVDNTGEDSDDAPVEVAYKSEKKSDNPEPVENDDTLAKSKNKFKKRKKNKKNRPQTDMNADQTEVNAKKRKYGESSTIDAADAGEVHVFKNQKKKKLFQYDEDGNPIQGGTPRQSKKRKTTEDDNVHRHPKVFKDNFFKKIHVPRLPDSVVNQLDDQPKAKKSMKIIGKAISTLPFIVQEGPRRNNKPSNYLEQSICLNDSVSPVRQKKKKIQNPKVLPFTPTVLISGKGYTSKFNINVLPQETQFIAQASCGTNFRDEFLSRQRAKKIRVERFKKQRNHKLEKF